MMNSILKSLLTMTWVMSLSGFAAEETPKLEPQLQGQQLELRWRSPNAAGSGGRAVTYELQSSEDLRSWTRQGDMIRSVSADGLHLRSLATDRARAFYRLLATTEAARALTAAGGAEVFGYGSAFAAELAKLGQITPDQFAALFPFPTNYVPQVSFDVTKAKYFQDFNADPELVNLLRIPPFEPLRNTDFRLNTNELAVFRKNGFVVSERLAMPSFADQFYRVWKDDMPVFISTDAILQAWHRSYDAMLEELEETFLYENLDRMLDGMAVGMGKLAGEVGNGGMKESALDADYFLSVARSLLKGTNVPSALGQERRVAGTLERVRTEEPELDTCFPLFGVPRAVDFSQFKVRGHYENSPRLGRYFQAVMWLGRTDLRLAGGPFQDSDCMEPHPAPPRELGTAVVLNWLLARGGQFERWRQFERAIQAFVGWTDSATFAQLGDLLKAAKVNGPADLPDQAALLGLQQQIAEGKIGVQSIRADYFVSPLGRDQIVLPQSFTVFGQKFVPDNWALAQSVFDGILWDGGKVYRRVPSGLDVMFSTLGNNQAVPELLARMRDTSATRHPLRDGLAYQHNLAAVRRVMDRQGAKAYQGSIYMDWLGTLRELSLQLTNSSTPQAFRTKAWAMKSLNTQMASWSQLRHDTILYAKQSYTGGGLCDYPAVLVEPHPTFWGRMHEMVGQARETIGNLNYEGRVKFVFRPVPAGFPEEELQMQEMDLEQVQFRQLAQLDRFRDALDKLRAIVEMQEAGQPISSDPWLEDFACGLIQRLTPGGGSGGVRTYTGWYPQLFYRSILHERNNRFDEDSGVGRFDAIVADVHTDPPAVGDPGSVLHEGLGAVNLAFVVADHAGRTVMFAGPVLSHFEFELIGPPRRLSDSQWKDSLQGGMPLDPPLRPAWRSFTDEFGGERRLPPLPPWTRDYLVPRE